MRQALSSRAVLARLYATCLVIGCSSDAFIAARGDVDDANALLAAGRFADALEAYDALESTNPRVAFNRGLALFGLDKWDEAITAFDEARGSKDPGMKALAWLHAGNAHVRKGLALEGQQKAEEAKATWESAVDAFENALTLDPSLQDAKTQLELALLRVDPPCHLRNDAKEPNNTFAVGASLELAAAEDEKAAPGERRAKAEIAICPDDQDWFKVPLEAGDRLIAKVQKTAGPDHASLQVSAWSLDGKARLGGAPSEEPDPTGKRVPVRDVSLTGVKDAGEYRLLISDPNGDDSKGTLEVTVRPACERTEGPEEPNDTRAAAKPLPSTRKDPKAAAQAPPAPPGAPPPGPAEPSPPTGAPGEPQPTVARLCPGNEDWFVVDVPAGESLEVTAQTRVQSGKVKLTLEDASGAVLAEAKPGEKDTLTALAYTPTAGQVFVHVVGEAAADPAGPGTEAVYALTAARIPPCAEREDDNEDNDSSAAASALGPTKVEERQLCPGDADVYSVSVKPGESVIAHLVAKPIHGTPKLTVTDGATQVLGEGFPLKDGILAMGLNPGEGTYYVEVTGDADAEYDLEIQVMPACPEGNDTEEQNDDPDRAKALALGQPDPSQVPQGAAPEGGGQPEPITKLLRICPGDVDWFRIGVTPESQLLVASIEFVHEKGDLTLTELDADGETVVQEAAPSAATTNIEAVVVPPPDVRVPDPTDYLIRIEGAGPEVENFYVLTLRPLPPSGKDGNDGESNDQQEPKDDEQQSEPKEPEEQEPQEPKPDKATLEKQMEADDKQDQNLEAMKARMRDRLKAPPVKDW